MTIYRDARGWRYRVMPGLLGGKTYKARYNKSVACRWHWKCMSHLPWRDTAEEAQADLDQLAARKGWEQEATA